MNDKAGSRAASSKEKREDFEVVDEGFFPALVVEAWGEGAEDSRKHYCWPHLFKFCMASLRGIDSSS